MTDQSSPPAATSKGSVKRRLSLVVPVLPPLWRRLIVAIVLVVASTFIRLTLFHALGTRNIYIMFYPAVVLAALHGGLFSGMVATVASSVLADYFFIQPVHSLNVYDAADWLGLGIFMVSGTMISGVTEAMHRARNRAHAAEIEANNLAARQRETEARAVLAAIVESTEDAILTKDLHGRIKSWNAAAERVFGYRASEIIGQHVFTIIPEDRRQEEVTVDQHLSRGEPIPHYETVRLAKDGRRLDVSLTVSPLLDTAGRVVGASKIIQDISERKRAEEALRESEAKYRNLFESMVEEVHFWRLVRDEAGNIQTWRLVDANPPALKSWGRTTVEEIRGKTTDEIFGAGATEHYLPIVRKIFEEGVPHSYEDYFPHLGKHFRFTSVPLGEHFITTGSDITELKKVNDALRASEERLRQDVDALTRLQQLGTRFVHEGDLAPLLGEIVEAAIAISGADFGNIQLLDPKTSDLVIAAQRGFPQWWLEFWVKVAKGCGTCGTALERGERVIVEDVERSPIFIGAAALEAQLKAGVRAVQSTPLMSRSGKPLGIFSTHFKRPHRPDDRALRLLDLLARQTADIIARTEAEAQIKEEMAERKRAQDQLRLQLTVLQSTANAIAITGPDGTIQWINAAFTRLTGYSPEEVLGKNPRVLKSERHSPAFYKELWTTILAGRVWHGELVNKRKDGALYSEEMTITPVKGAEGTITHFVAVKQDISGRKQAEEELRRTAAELARSNLELQQFAYVASHDLQEPLRAVTGYLTMVEERLRGMLDEKARRHIEGAVEGASRMHTLINDLLELSRVGSKFREFVPTEMNEVLDAALEWVSPRVRESGAKITRDPLPRLKVDATQMTLLFQNLIGNAIKFRGDKPPEIHVGVQRNKDHWTFAVRDNGIGMEPRYFDRIFQIFQRLHTRKDYPGTGIGLAICKKVVERHGGRIWVESQPGLGSTFFFTIPDSPL